MRQAKLRAVFMRGGTSKAVVFNQADLPSDRAVWPKIFRAIMGSPDIYGRQLDGMGGGVSSVSKICIVGKSERTDADVDYTFAQISVKDGAVDFSGNCGNMSSAIGPFAVEEGLAPYPQGNQAIVRIYNTNTSKIIVSRFNMDDTLAAVDGEMTIDGVTGTGAPIRLDFESPGGTKTGRLLPSGNPTDQITIPELGQISISLVDAANPCVFVRAQDLGFQGTELPEALEQEPVLLERLEFIRRTASVMMGLAPDVEAAGQMKVLPIVAMICSPVTATLLSGKTLDAKASDIVVRMISTGQPHRAVPVTGALCLAIACRIPGSLPQQLLAQTHPDQDIRIAHPSGVFIAAAKVTQNKEDGVVAHYGTVYRTSRRLFEGHVLYRPGSLS